MRIADICLKEILYGNITIEQLCHTDCFAGNAEVDADEFIAVKGFKAKGKRITTYTVETINELEPTRFPEPEQEPQEEASEEPENLDPDSDKSEGDIIDEITGQMKLF